jgi:hypothetical protein
MSDVPQPIRVCHSVVNLAKIAASDACPYDLGQFLPFSNNVSDLPAIVQQF